MIRELVHDPIFLAQPSVPATADDLPVAQDLLETLLAHEAECVGMAANMIGVRKNIIAVTDGDAYLLMLNPEILKAEGPFDTEESCLSLLGGPRPTKRYRKIKVRWQTPTMQVRIKTFSDFTAQIIQHEVDHLSGVLI
ncbi:MAG: peptide deformylase [Clostridia bacterium]|nr:peptide deformylase [Clostridia bacterium]